MYKNNGRFSSEIKGGRVLTSVSLMDRCTGVETIGNGIWKVFYRTVFLGYFNGKDIRGKENR